MTKTKGGGRDGAENVSGGCDIGMQRQRGYPPAAAAGGDVYKRQAIQGVNYNLATQSCDTRNTIQNTTRDIIDAMNCGFRSIDQRLTAQELAAKDQKIADQNQQLFMAQLAASQNAQNLTIKGYVENQFAYYNPRPVPAYQVQNPNCCYGNGYGCGSVA